MDSSSLPSGVHSLRSFTEYGGVETWALNPLLVAFKLLFGFRSVFLKLAYARTGFGVARPK